MIKVVTVNAIVIVMKTTIVNVLVNAKATQQAVAKLKEGLLN